MGQYIDLHVHTCFSDGTATPRELLDLARDNDLAALAVTDHDTLEGYRAVKQILSDGDPELISGVELSVTLDGDDLHLLAYLVEADDDNLSAALKRFQQHRIDRGRLMVDKLNSLGVNITYRDVEKQADGAVVGRPHVARAMYEKKTVERYEEAFERYIRTGGPAYVPKANFLPGDAIDLTHNAGGLAILAHPGVEAKDKYLEMLLDLGLDGLEVYHPAHSAPDIDRFKHLAEKYDLIPTGGSDFHGQSQRYDTIGTQKVPYKYLETLKSKKKRGSGD
jgi:predicted metal-dependent phosphoesterase TrpH